jgi:hypothetical protein
MKHLHLSELMACTLFITMLFTNTTSLAADWKVSLNPSYTIASYQGSTNRQNLYEKGFTLSTVYKEELGLTLGLSNTFINFDGGAYTDQNNSLLSGNWKYAALTVPGKWNARFDIHSIKNNDTTGNTDQVKTLAPQLSWTSNTGALYLDLGYARSTYLNNLSVHQFTPTIGFSLNDGYDWVQIRGYAISGMNPERAVGKSATSAVDFKWTHYLTPARSAYKPASFSVGLMAGEKLYAVDMDAQSVANIADVQTSGINVAGNWTISKASKLMLLAGQSGFRKIDTTQTSNIASDYQIKVFNATLFVDF